MHRALFKCMAQADQSSAVAISAGIVGDTQECRFWATKAARVTKLLSRYTQGASTALCEELPTRSKSLICRMKASFSGFFGWSFNFRHDPCVEIGSKPLHVKLGP